MTEIDCEYEYKSTVSRIGGALLIFLLMLAVSQGIYHFMLQSIGTEDMPSYLICNIPYAILYFASFTLPLIFFKRFSRKTGSEPVRIRPHLTPDTPLLIVGGIGLILACAVINNLILLPWISPNLDMEDLYLPTEYSEPYHIIMQFVSMALVPGICEELLFRGMVLSNLLPYGKTGAVIASSLLFGLMHQNPGQMFYATMAGFVLALIYIYTGSILCSMLVHICNNAFSVWEEVLIAHLPESEQWLIGVIDSVMILIAAVALLLLVFAKRKRLFPKFDFRSGVFGKKLPEAECYDRKPVLSHRKVRLFFAPTMILFLVITLLEMVAIMFILVTGMV